MLKKYAFCETRPDLPVLSALALALTPLALFAFGQALTRAKIEGSLAQFWAVSREMSGRATIGIGQMTRKRETMWCSALGLVDNGRTAPVMLTRPKELCGTVDMVPPAWLR